MGTTRIDVTLRIPGSPDVAYQNQFVVDTGATDCVVPVSMMKKAGVRPVGKMTYELANGSRHQYDVGIVQIEFLGETTAGRVIFGSEDIEPILGVTALESVGVVVDPVRRELRRVPAIPFRRTAATLAAALTVSSRGRAEVVRCCS